MEEILLAPRMDFSQIRKLGYKRSNIGLTGTIINVLASLDRVKTTLPRYIDDYMIVSVMLKRKMEYKNDYLSRNILPKKVIIALHDFCSTSLYKIEQIVINDEWEKHFDQRKKNHERVFLNELIFFFIFQGSGA